LSVQSSLDFFVFSDGGVSDEEIGGVCWNFVILWELLKGYDLNGELLMPPTKLSHARVFHDAH